MQLTTSSTNTSRTCQKSFKSEGKFKRLMKIPRNCATIFFKKD